MDTIFQKFGLAQDSRNGYELAECISPDHTTQQLEAIYHSSKPHNAQNYIRRGLQDAPSSRLDREELDAWTKIIVQYWNMIGDLLDAQKTGLKAELAWTKVYNAWKETVSLLIRGYQTQNYPFEAWTIPCLYTAGKYLRVFAIKADDERNAGPANGQTSSATFSDDMDLEAEQNQQLEDCARQLNRIFNLCLNDRAPLEESRKWGIYYIINLLFKTYFKLNQGSLSRNVLRALLAYKGDMPELSAFPKAQQVTFKYYEGVLAFLEENYLEAEKHLNEALRLCQRSAVRNKELVLTYLIPCHLLTTHTLPSRKLLAPYPRLQAMFGPISVAIRKGDLKGFDMALVNAEDVFIKRRIYLTLERGRDIAMRNLLRKVFVEAGYEEPKEADAPKVKQSRIPVANFTAAASFSSQAKIDSDEVECQMANMIYKGLMKGYISRERQMVVLSKVNAFPGTGI